MLAAERNIDRLPTWAVRAHAPAQPRTDWVKLGSEYDIAHISKLWQQVMRFRLEDLPNDESIMWQLADKLRGRRSDIVIIREAVVSIDRRHMRDFREAIDWLWDELCDDHQDDFCDAHTEDDEIVCIRKDDAPPPMTKLEDSRTAIEIIEALRDGWVDNIVKL
ncbi:hypothetical protein [Agrobacterium tumefaciens]|uniref:hypothetical protein n=1 Tax=Agrobacterium tumefaciens TaxID=358 RepID=UPI0028576BC1|nr:hypothetical protein [Agrobacterium tumefaciens]MDR6587401.1 hypothetical protein [Agrobacterium tumefaciens]